MPQLHWQPRISAPTPAGVVAKAALAGAVLTLLRQRDADSLLRLSAVATRDLLVILGPTAELPWLDGVRYCAPEACAPALWLPTHTAPALPLDLVQDALLRRADSRPVLLWHAPEHILPLSQALPLTTARLDWLSGELG
ncbi:hypothetical protein [Duganella sp.]|uniref:bpX5 domain-containing protein n=1 Tax=Duganella sp. TaxID=1904440 RepID=UPI0031D4C830